jgi:hypothetical protein
MASLNTRGLYVPMYLSRQSQTWLKADYEPDDATPPEFGGTVGWTVGGVITVVSIEFDKQHAGYVNYRIPPATVADMPALGAWYTVVMTPSGGQAKQILEGPVEVSR